MRGHVHDAPMALDGIVFDLDGTLVDTNAVHVEAWRRVFEDHGYKIAPDRIFQEVGKGGDNLVIDLLGKEADQKDGESLREAHPDMFGKLARKQGLKVFPRVQDLFAELKRRGLKLPFETISRADRMMKEEVLETLAEMGCYRIWIGAESGSQRILDSMQRGVTVEQVEWATRAAQRHGIEVGMFLMWGYDGEELDDIEATVEQVKKWNPNVFLTTVAYPIKNTPYFTRIADRAVLTKEWSTATDRDFAIRGRHSREYYQHADKWLRNEVAACRLEQDDPAQAAARRADGLAGDRAAGDCR